MIINDSCSIASSNEDEEFNSLAQRLHKIFKKQGKKYVKYKKYYSNIKYECLALIKKLEKV